MKSQLWCNSHTCATNVQAACSDLLRAIMFEEMMIRANAPRALLICKSDPGLNWHETCKAYVPSSSDTLICPETTRKRQLPQLSNSPEGSF